MHPLTRLHRTTIVGRLAARLYLLYKLSANLEGRGFFFGAREIDWKIDRFPVGPGLGEALRQQLGPIRFTPGFFQATAGLSLRL